mmetsp:Transcript_36831/g.83039  ORF Transcript_36831/g.83039 Transcript_36831/m.83039 type:complete len:241 (-) Transcript_36831:1009-1731(-)
MLRASSKFGLLTTPSTLSSSKLSASEEQSTTFSGLPTVRGSWPSVMARIRLDASSCGILAAAWERSLDTARRFCPAISNPSSPSRLLQHQRTSRSHCSMDLRSSFPRPSRITPSSSTVYGIHLMAPSIAPLVPTCLASSTIAHPTPKSVSSRVIRVPSMRARGHRIPPSLSPLPQTRRSLCGMQTLSQTSEHGASEERSLRRRICRSGWHGCPTVIRSYHCPCEEISPTSTQALLERSSG